MPKIAITGSCFSMGAERTRDHLEMRTKPIDMAKNVLGGELAVCGTKPLTGWTRNGCCETDAQDFGSHTVCAIVDERFLRYSAAVGNDLSTSGPSFDGLKPGDRWCLCASRWNDAYLDGMAPPVDLEACHERALDVVELDVLKAHAVKA